MNASHPLLIRFAILQGLEHVVVDSSGDDPLIRRSSSRAPAEHALRGFDGVRAYAQNAEHSRGLLEGVLAFEPSDGTPGGAASGARSTYAYPPAAGRWRHRGRGHGPPRRLGAPDGPARGLGATRRRAPGRQIVIDRLRLLLRSTSASRAGRCLEIATIGPGFADGRSRRSRSAQKSRRRRAHSSTCARRSRRRSRRRGPLALGQPLARGGERRPGPCPRDPARRGRRGRRLARRVVRPRRGRRPPRRRARRATRRARAPGRHADDEVLPRARGTLFSRCSSSSMRASFRSS